MAGEHSEFWPFDKPFGRPFYRLMVLSDVEGLMVQSTVEGLTALSEVEGHLAPLFFCLNHRILDPF